MASEAGRNDEKVEKAPRLLKSRPNLASLVLLDGQERDDSDGEYEALGEEVVKEHATHTLPQFWKDRYEAEAHKYWDKFYHKCKTNFFKDRHWILNEFAELRPLVDQESRSEDGCTAEPTGRSVVLECGCGVGNTVYPVLEANPSLRFHCFDYSRRAIEFVKSHPNYDPRRVHAFVCDMASESIVRPEPLAPDADLFESGPLAASVDVATMFFVLSALSPETMTPALQHVCETLKIGGRILLRDYAQYDLSQLRFDKTNRIAEDFYVRKDGTRVYFFTCEFLEGLARDCGLEVLESEVVKSEVVNRKDEIRMRRRFVQMRFQRAAPCS